MNSCHIDYLNYLIYFIQIFFLIQKSRYKIRIFNELDFILIETFQNLINLVFQFFIARLIQYFFQLFYIYHPSIFLIRFNFTKSKFLNCKFISLISFMSNWLQNTLRIYFLNFFATWKFFNTLRMVKSKGTISVL